MVAAVALSGLTCLMRTHQRSARRTSGTSEWHCFERGVDLCEAEGVVGVCAVKGEMQRKEEDKEE